MFEKFFLPSERSENYSYVDTLNEIAEKKNIIFLVFDESNVNICRCAETTATATEANG